MLYPLLESFSGTKLKIVLALLSEEAVKVFPKKLLKGDESLFLKTAGDGKTSKPMLLVDYLCANTGLSRFY